MCDPPLQGHRGAGLQRAEGLHGDEQYLIRRTHGHLQVGPPAVREFQNKILPSKEKSVQVNSLSEYQQSILGFVVVNVLNSVSMSDLVCVKYHLTGQI